MRIDGWQVDGFGVLKDASEQGLERGVTVLLGENEAGKSTLLAFIRAILYGFPRANARDERSYPPLNGGRHGGRLLLRDGDEGLWIVGRHADRRDVELTRPDGAAADPADLAVLLGHTDRPLFRSVFAFGLEELQQFATLTGEGVRDRIFSAGISGAGKSAREAIASLEKQQAALLKQGRGEAELNNLVREIQRIDTEIAEARRLAARYAEFERVADEQEAVAATLGAQADDRQRLKTEVEALITLRPEWERLEGLRLELAGLPPRLRRRSAERGERRRHRPRGAAQSGAAPRGAARRPDGCVRRAPGVTVAARRRLGHGSRRRLRRKRSRERRGAQLGWSGERCRAGADDRPAAPRRCSPGRRAGPRRARGDAPGAAGHRTADHRADRRRRGSPGRAAQRRPEPAGAAAPGRTGGVRPRLRAFWPSSCSPAWRPSGRSYRSSLGYAQLGVGLVVAAALAGAAAAVLRRRPRPAAGDAPARPGVVAEAETAIRAAARALGLPDTPVAQDLAAREADFRTQRTRRAEWTAVQARVNDARQRREQEEGVLATAVAKLETAEAEAARVAGTWDQWRSSRDLAGLSPDAVSAVMDEVETARRARKDHDTATAAVAAIEGAAAAWDANAAELLQAAGRQAGGLSGEPLRSALLALEGDLTRRDELLAEADGLERTLAVGLSASRDAEAAADELATGDRGIWQDRAERLDEEVRTLRADRDSAMEQVDRGPHADARARRVRGHRAAAGRAGV